MLNAAVIDAGQSPHERAISSGDIPAIAARR